MSQTFSQLIQEIVQQHLPQSSKKVTSQKSEKKNEQDEQQQQSNNNNNTSNISLSKSQCLINSSIFVKERTIDYHQNKFSHEKSLGKGSFGEVTKIVDKKTNQTRAQKKINKEDIDPSDLNEIQILKKLDHPNILKIYDFYQDSESYYINTEYCEYGDLTQELKSQIFEEEETQIIMKQILSAIHHSHSRGIVHRDLKTDNVMIDFLEDLLIKVIDWGLAVTKLENIDEYAGTPTYMAPEVVKQIPYSLKCDIWSCGVILYQLLTGLLPFQHDKYAKIVEDINKESIYSVKKDMFNQLGYKQQLEVIYKIQDKQLEDLILKGTFDLEIELLKNVSDEGKDLIKQMLTYDPKTRPTAQQCLQHVWFQKKKQSSSKHVHPQNVKHTLSSMKDFKAEKTLQQATYLYISSHLTSKEENQKLSNIFQELDSNHDGVLSKEELVNGYSKFFGSEIEKIHIENNIDEIMKQADLDQNGTIEYSEFLAACHDKKNASFQEALQEAFQLFDNDGDGKITVQEIEQILGSNFDKDLEIFKGILHEVDNDKNGQIDLQEFYAMMDLYVEQKFSNSLSQDNNKQ